MVKMLRWSRYLVLVTNREGNDDRVFAKKENASGCVDIFFFSDLDGIRTRTQDYLSCQCSCLVSLKKAHEKGNQINQKDLKCLLPNHHVVKAKCHSQNVMFLVIFVLFCPIILEEYKF